MLFRTIIINFYGIGLGCLHRKSSFHRICVNYNNAYRILYKLPRKIHIYDILLNKKIYTFHVFLRKHCGSFVHLSSIANSFLGEILYCDVLVQSMFYDHFTRLHSPTC